MPPPSEVPEHDLRRVADAQTRFLAAIDQLSDSDVTRPSALPTWTVGHVLAHVARNADSHIRRAEAATRGEVVDQYPGGVEGRAAEIDEGAHRSARDLVDDVRGTAEVLQAAWLSVSPSAWSGVSRDVSGKERLLYDLPGRRWQELEVHVIDLGVGVTYRDWPDDFVAVSLSRLRPDAAQRLPAEARLPGPGQLDDREELAWLYGRLTRPDLPELGHWS
jgi:maleylpyruvate isomerase